MEEAIWTNLCWFSVIWMVAILMGMAWAWKKKVAIGLTIIGLILMVIFTLIAIGYGDFSEVSPWYYYIGSILGGATWTLPFNISVRVYDRHFA